MKIETFTKGRSLRVLFDHAGHEFSYTDFNDKILTIKQLYRANLLDKALEKYKDQYDNSNYSHAYNDLKSTLIGYLVFLKTNKALYYVPKLNELPLEEIIAQLKSELEKFNSEYSYEKLVSAYVNNNTEEYHKQSAFFMADFDKDITESLRKRDDIENKPFHLSYVHLFNFLKINLLASFQKNEFYDFMIDMGMAPNVQEIVKRFLQTPDKNSYLQAVEHISKIIYWKMSDSKM